MSRRFLAKLIANVVTGVMSVATLYFLPRALGNDFGTFDLVFTQIMATISFVALGLPNAFAVWFARESENPRQSQPALALTTMIYVAIFVAIICGVYLAINGQYHHAIWPDTHPDVIVFATLYAIVMIAWQQVSSLADSTKLTVNVEFFKILHALSKLLLLGGFFYASWLNLKSSSIIQITTQVVLIVCTLIYIQYHLRYPLVTRASFHNTSIFFKYLISVSIPLILYNFVGYIHKISDRWLLQWFNGAEAQSQLALSNKTASISSLLCGAMMPLLLRDMAVAHHSGKREEIHSILKQSQPIVALTTLLAVYFAFYAQDFAEFFGGESVTGATIPLAIMAFYPIHQTINQMGHSIAVATDRLRSFTTTSIIFMIVSIPLGFIVLGPLQSALPASLQGASTLAMKTVVLQLLQANVILYLHCRSLQQNFRRWIIFQIYTLVGFGAVGFVSVWVRPVLVGEGQSTWKYANLGMGSITYFLLACLLLAFDQRMLGGYSVLRVLHQIKSQWRR